LVVGRAGERAGTRESKARALARSFDGSVAEASRACARQIACIPVDPHDQKTGSANRRRSRMARPAHYAGRAQCLANRL